MTKTLIFVVAAVFLGGSLVWKMQPARSQADDSGSAATAPGHDANVIAALARASDVIASGRCIGTRSEWVSDGRILVTLADIAVDEAVKGEPGSIITVALPGGIDMNRPVPVAMTYPGASRISEDENVFLFLVNDQELVPGSYVITGYSEGKFSIVTDDAGNKLVSPDNVREHVKGGPGIVRGNRPFVSLESFKSKVREYAGQ